MSNTFDFKIRQQLAAYLAGKISRRQFEDWFFAETWDILELFYNSPALVST